MVSKVSGFGLASCRSSLSMPFSPRPATTEATLSGFSEGPESTVNSRGLNVIIESIILN